MSKHVLVWLDHHEAHIFDIQPDAFSESTLRAPARHLRRHPKGASEAKAHPEDAKHFFDELAKALLLQGAEEVLVVGPGTAKLHFLKHVHQHQQALASKIFGVETVDHPTDKQLVAYAKHYFTAADRMR
jgi:stalled ribosome rescue protein Dom34